MHPTPRSSVLSGGERETATLLPPSPPRAPKGARGKAQTGAPTARGRRAPERARGNRGARPPARTRAPPAGGATHEGRPNNPSAGRGAATGGGGGRERERRDPHARDRATRGGAPRGDTARTGRPPRAEGGFREEADRYFSEGVVNRCSTAGREACYGRFETGSSDLVRTPTDLRLTGSIAEFAGSSVAHLSRSERRLCATAHLRVDGTCRRTNLRPRGPAAEGQEYFKGIGKSLARVSRGVCLLVLLYSWFLPTPNATHLVRSSVAHAVNHFRHAPASRSVLSRPIRR